MQDEATSRRRAVQALMEELAARNGTIPSVLLEQIYEIEERVQFLDDRGPVLDRIARLIQSELDKPDAE